MILEKGRSALVTGGAGFIGSHLAEALLARGLRVTVADNLSSGDPGNLASVAHRVDLRSLDLLRDDLGALLREASCDIVFHLAGSVDISGSVMDPRGDLETNAVATLRLLEALRATSREARILYASSAAVYGDQRTEGLSEGDPTVPVAPYGVSKLAGERYVALYATLHGLATASLRLFPVYGPRLRRHVVYDLMRKIHENPRELVIQGDGSQVRDLSHVANVVEAFVVVAELGAFRGEVYNVASEEAVSIRDLAAMICERLGASPRFTYTGSVRPGHAQRWSADISRLKALGYVPRIRLAEGLDDVVAWFRRELAAERPPTGSTPAPRPSRSS